LNENFITCRACGSEHPLSWVMVPPVIFCPQAPCGSYTLIDTRYLKDEKGRLMTGYDGPLWVYCSNDIQ